MKFERLPREIVDLAVKLSNEALYLADINAKILFANKKAYSSIGYTADEISKLKVSDIDKEMTKESWKAFLEQLKHEGHVLLETVHHRKDGSSFPVEVNITYFQYEGNDYFLGLARDTSKRDELLKTLKKREHNLNEAQRLASIGHWELDLVNNELFWSDEVYRIFGLQPQEFGATYEAFLDHVYPDDHDLVNRAYATSVENKSSYQITHRVKTKQGDIKYVEERCSHEFDESGNVIRSIGTVHDVTRRVENEKQLKLASNVFTHSSDAIIITNKENRIVSVNKAFETLTLYSESEVLGQNPKVLSSGWGDEAFYKAMWENLHARGIWQGEIWDRKKNGDLYAAAESIVVVKNEQGNIENYIGISHDITEKKESEQQIKQLAYYDFLTKLPNRKLFQQEVESFIKSSHFNSREFAILFMDLDNFKWVNDSLGHHYGDKVLIHAAKLLSGIIPEDAILARLGGDEFVILTPYNELLDVSHLATEITQTLHEPIMLDTHEVNLGWSVGISLYPANGITYETLLQNADTAMYGAKEKGKNRFQYFSEEMNESAKKRLEIDTRLRHALKEGGFTLVYQPQYSCQKHKTIGFEALIRWNDAKLGFVPPDMFIPVAEQSGYIYDIGLWVLKKALEDLKTIHAATRDDSYKMAVNISVKQFESKQFITDVVNVLKEKAVDARRIEFEVTETAVMQNIQSVVPVLEKIKALGIELSIDDFGTGYSSLAYLKKMPLDSLKIDREFIAEIDADSEDRAIVKATLALARALQLKTVAEGVETQVHSDILVELHCDSYQGYFYAKPMPLEALLEFLKA